MRLIDGDALKASVLKQLPPDPCGREDPKCVSLLQEIDEAPTIDAAPIRRGEWADVHFRTVPYDRITGAKKCPYCGKKKDKYVQWNWCPNCGAKLMNNKPTTLMLGNV